MYRVITHVSDGNGRSMVIDEQTFATRAEADAVRAQIKDGLGDKVGAVVVIKVRA